MEEMVKGKKLIGPMVAMYNKVVWLNVDGSFMESDGNHSEANIKKPMRSAFIDIQGTICLKNYKINRFCKKKTTRLVDPTVYTQLRHRM
jgi:hypothetical protein